MRITAIAVAGVSSALTACATSGPPPEILEAEAALLGPQGVQRGEAHITQLDTGVRIVIRGYGLHSGVHGAHIHETGACEPPDFASAGGHWNPLNRAHGRENPAGQHMGDMPNLLVGLDSTGLLEVTINGARIANGPNALLDEDGAAIMIHAMADDYMTDPSGDAGARVACGVVESILD